MSEDKIKPKPTTYYIETTDPHKTQRIPIKMEDVDINIIPVVVWLNSFSSVITLFSCEGDEVDEDDDEFDVLSKKPYVLFICSDQMQLMHILEYSQQVSTTEISMHNTQIRYCMRFNSKEEMLDFSNHECRLFNGDIEDDEEET